jgi:WD40 repeat protein
MYTVPAHSALISHVRFEPNHGEYLLSSSYDNKARPPSLAAHLPLTAAHLPLTCRALPLTCRPLPLTVSPPAARCSLSPAAAQALLDARLLTLHTLHALHTLHSLHIYVTQVKLWSMRDFSLLKTMEGHEGRVMCGDISDDGKYFATAAMDRTWKLWG